MKTKRAAISIFVCIVLSGFGCDGGPNVKWESYTPEIMAASLKSGKPTVAYFYAAWCGPCMKLKYTTFSDPKVVNALEPFNRIKVDMSYVRSSKQIQGIAGRYKIESFPSVLFFNSKGEEMTRLYGFVPANQFLYLLETYRNQFAANVPLAH